MIKRTLKQLAKMAGGTLTGAADENMLITGVSQDSRTTQPNELFVPLNIGYRFDGHDFVQDAFAKGAVASLWQQDRPHPPKDRPLIIVPDTLKALHNMARAYRQQLSVKVIGVTGSNGKTTTKDMLTSILSKWGKVHYTEGNLNNHVGLPMTILEADEDAEWMVLEMGMSGRGEIELLSKIANPDAAVITNIGEAHLLQLGSRLEIAKAKLEIIAGMKSNGVLIYPGDEPLLRQLFDMEDFEQECGYSCHSSIERISYGLSEANDHYLQELKQDPVKEACSFRLNGWSQPLFIPIFGKHNVLNAAAAAVCMKRLGVSEDAIRQGLIELKITGMRADVVMLPSGAKVYNQAFNASPSSVRASIQALIELEGKGRKIAVLADMLELGADEVKFHREIGAELDPGQIDEIYTYGELASHIADAARERYPHGKVHSFASKQDLTASLRKSIRKNDMILVKGSRGMKMEEVIEGLLQEEGE